MDMQIAPVITNIIKNTPLHLYVERLAWLLFPAFLKYLYELPTIE
jgi:hypothetical protein